MKKQISILFTILFFGILTVGCNTEVPMINKTSYNFEWVSPIENSTLINSDLEENQTEIKLTYDSLPIPSEIDINFNSQNVVECFEFFPNEGLADLNCFKGFFKEGKNTLQVMNENFGPKLNFNIEFQGPSFAIREVCYENSTHCDETISVSEGNVNVEIEYRDFSGIDSVTLNDVEPYLSVNENTKRFLVELSDTYTFNSLDNFGNNSQIVYKADGQEISEILKVRVDETFIGNIKEILSEGISGIFLPEGDESLQNLQNLDGGGGLVCNVSVKELKLGKVEIKDIGISNSNSNAQITTDILIEPINDYVFNNGSISDFSDVGVEVLVDTRIRLFGCGRFGSLPINGLRLFIETLEVNSDVDVNIVDEKFNLTLNNSSNGAALVYYDAGLSDQNPILNGFVDLFLGLGFVRDLILGIVQNVVNSNLEEIIIGGEIKTESETSLGVFLQPTELFVKNNEVDNVGDIFIKLKGEVETLIRNEKVLPALGSYYVDDSELPLIPDNDSSLAVVLNSNIINQGLLSAYNIGVTHLTVLNEEVFIGPDVTDNLGSEGDIRIELYPASPGQFFIEGNDVDKAYLEYNGAELTVSIKNNENWKQLFLVDVDIKAGVLISVRDSKFYMTIAEDPFFDIRKITDLGAKREIKTPFGSLFVSFNITGQTVKKIVEEALIFAIPYVAESELEIDISELNLPRKLTTETVSTENEHLSFDIGIKEEE